LSLTTDPANLFSEEKGIYVVGKVGHDYLWKLIQKKEEALSYVKSHPEVPLDGSVSICGICLNEGYTFNYSQGGREWERPVDAVFFDMWQTPVLEKRMGLRVRGHNSRNFPQKSLALFMRQDLSGAGQYFFPYLSKEKRSTVALSGGADDMYTNVKDKLASMLFSNLNFGCQEFSSPLYIFLNGEFWGTYLMSEKINEDYVKNHYGTPSSNMILIKNGEPEAGNIEKGLPLYDQLRQYLGEKDLSDPETYREFTEFFDMDSLLDYYAARLYIDDANDWPKTNVAMWRSIENTGRPYEDGKWRFLNFDNNSEFTYRTVETDTLESIMEQAEREENNIRRHAAEGRIDNGHRYELFLFYSLMQNREFRRLFLNRFQTIIDEIYEPEAAIAALEKVAREMRSPVVTGYSRWFGTRCSFKDFDEKIEEMRSFLLERRNIILPSVERMCNK
nr:CotH kinase family protein [Lachnospiraceae bacterium]